MPVPRRPPCVVTSYPDGVLVDVPLPTDLTGQRVLVHLHGAVTTAGILRIAAWDLLTNES